MEHSKSLLILLLIGPFISSSPNLPTEVYKNVSERIQIKPVKVLESRPMSISNDTLTLIEALIQVESNGDNSAIGDLHLPEPSIGVLQLRPIMVKDVNRILKRQKQDKSYKLKDRFSRNKSIEMFMIWKNYYHPYGSFETIARNWNGGPMGYKNKKTRRYWAKVQLELNKKDI